MSASWQVSVQAEDARELTELLRFADEHNTDVDRTSLDPPDARAIPTPSHVDLSYPHAEDPDDVAASLTALQRLRRLTGQLDT